ncbi:hypothetical protein MP228_001309 [Amoeboaphelidium protococcarum]|nr:hypothetical protein MP228_001309 [Amoeboaphelidium protococcarum]
MRPVQTGPYAGPSDRISDRSHILRIDLGPVQLFPMRSADRTTLTTVIHVMRPFSGNNYGSDLREGNNPVVMGLAREYKSRVWAQEGIMHLQGGFCCNQLPKMWLGSIIPVSGNT